MRIIVATLAGLVALTTVSAQAAAPSPKSDNYLQLSAALSFKLGPNDCPYGSHRKLWRDWMGEWHWGPCLRDR